MLYNAEIEAAQERFTRKKKGLPPKFILAENPVINRPLSPTAARWIALILIAIVVGVVLSALDLKF
jgi:Ni,Fe-hydrogenase I small subunit